MCLIGFALNVHPRYRLILAANRDEYLHRPTAPAHWWHDEQNLLGGRDLSAMGTWMAIRRDGRFAALTNFREGAPAVVGDRSRGELVRAYVAGRIEPEGIESDAYAGFNLLYGELAGSQGTLSWLSNRNGSGSRAVGHPISSGVHTLSNHLLDTDWPKSVQLAAALRTLIDQADSRVIEQGLWRTLTSADAATDDSLPDTGVGLERERTLSPPFIISDVYGTRSSTLLLIDRDGRAVMVERSWGAPAPDEQTRRSSARPPSANGIEIPAASGLPTGYTCSERRFEFSLMA